MNINGAFPSDYLKASDLNGRAYKLTMGNVTLEDIGSDRRPVLHFQGTEKGLVLNKTNASTISTLYGDETESWHGHPIEVYPSETDFQGKRVPCIRLRRPQVQQPAPAPLQPAPLQPSYGGNPNLPPSKQAEAIADNQVSGNTTPFDEQLDDSVPF